MHIKYLQYQNTLNERDIVMLYRYRFASVHLYMIYRVIEQNFQDIQLQCQYFENLLQLHARLLTSTFHYI